MAGAGMRGLPGDIYTVAGDGTQGFSGDGGPATARQSAVEGAAVLRSVLVFVFERELKLGPVGDRASLVQVNILLDDLSHPKIAERRGGSPDRLGGRVLPRRAACPDDLGHPVDAHAALL